MNNLDQARIYGTIKKVDVEVFNLIKEIGQISRTRLADELDMDMMGLCICLTRLIKHKFIIESVPGFYKVRTPADELKSKYY